MAEQDTVKASRITVECEGGLQLEVIARFRMPVGTMQPCALGEEVEQALHDGLLDASRGWDKKPAKKKPAKDD